MTLKNTPIPAREEKTLQVTSDHKTLVLNKLIAIEIGVVKVVKDEADVEAIKRIIDYGCDVANGFSLTFNNDGTKIRKDLYIK